MNEESELYQPLSELKLDGTDKTAVLRVLDIASKVFKEEGHCTPVLIMPEIGFVMPMIMNSDRAKEIGGHMMTQFSNETMTVFVSEVWMTRKQRQSEDGTYLRPSVDPEKRESVMVRVFLDQGKRQIIIHSEIIRPVGGKPWLKPWLIMTDSAHDEMKLVAPKWRKEEPE